MNPQHGPRFIRRRLGRRLRQWREAAGLSLEQAAAGLEKTRSTMHRLETGETLADIHLLKSMMDLYDQRDDSLFDLAREAAKPAWYRHYALKDVGYVDMETEASAVHQFAALNIPGLLQADGYIRVQIQQSPSRGRAEVRDQIKTRTIRKQRLTDEANPLTLHAIIDEAALTRLVGSREVMAEQLRYLVQVSKLDTVSIQVLPFDVGKHDSMEGAFSVLSFPEADEPDVLYVEYRVGALYTEKPGDVRPATLVLERLRAQALPEAESVELINSLLVQRYGVR